LNFFVFKGKQMLLFARSREMFSTDKEETNPAVKDVTGI